MAFSNSKATNYSHESDILLNDITSKIFLKDELINIYQTLLNSKKLLYWGESGFTYNKPPVRGGIATILYILNIKLMKKLSKLE